MAQNSLYEPRYRSIIKRLINARLSAGLSQEELAAKISISQPDISKVENFVRKLELLELIDWIKATSSASLAPAARALEEADGQH